MTAHTFQVHPSILLHADGPTVLGSSDACVPPLAHPLVALRHAEVTLGPGRPRLRDLGAGTYVNGQFVSGRQVDLEVGDQIDIGPFAFQFTGNELQTLSSMDSVQVMAHSLSRIVYAKGQDRAILNDVSLVIRPGEFVCLLGPSGCGKSTLMAALSGRAKPDAGQVRVNHRDLYTHFEAIKKHMVLVPQKPLLHQDLTVDQALRFTARLRLPASVNRKERVNEMIAAMKLDAHRHQLIRELSGGQEKRVSLANELLADPGLVFLDEVTSGLDENIDGEMMRLFRSLANQGKTVVCITHSLVHVPETCDLVVFLAPGGRLAYVGPPALALQYFNVQRLGDVYSLLDADNADQWARQFVDSSEHATFVADRLPQGDFQSVPSASRAPVAQIPAEVKTVASQSCQLLLRQLVLLWRDKTSLGSLFVQVLLVALVLGLAFDALGDIPKDAHKDNANAKGARAEGLKDAQLMKRMDWVRKAMNLSFLVAVTCFWFGCNNAAREIVRERSITTQERHFNLRPFAYYFSKLLILTIVSWFQVGLLMAIVWQWCGPPVEWKECIPLLFSLSFAGTTLGLFLSAIAPSERVAVTLIPIAVIPQIILSGAIVKLEGLAVAIGQLMVTTYWGKRGMDGMLRKDIFEFAHDDPVNLITSEGVRLPYVIILIHAAIFAVLTLAALSTDGTLGGITAKIKAWSGWLFRFGGRRPASSSPSSA